MFATQVMRKDWIRANSMAAAVTREINLMASLKHRNVVELKEVMNSNANVFLVLEFVDGRELYDEIVDKGQLDEVTSRSYFAQMVAGVAYLHGQGVAHRFVYITTLIHHVVYACCYQLWFSCTSSHCE
jgi:5'-AMP-activated protein kinase, catalytic alpha subunit